MKLGVKGSHSVSSVAFGDTFMYFDTNNRWAYKGSNTIPPCHQNWYRNVAMNVYPIKQKHLD
jgi:carbonic anhydrase